MTYIEYPTEVPFATKIGERPSEPPPRGITVSTLAVHWRRARKSKVGFRLEKDNISMVVA
jgi:hypothetical protein